MFGQGDGLETTGLRQGACRLFLLMSSVQLPVTSQYHTAVPQHVQFGPSASHFAGYHSLLARCYSVRYHHLDKHSGAVSEPLPIVPYTVFFFSSFFLVPLLSPLLLDVALPVRNVLK